MRRFVDLRPAEIEGYRFAFWDTVHERFDEYAGDQAWNTWDDMMESMEMDEPIPELIVRYRGLCPPWAFLDE